MIEFLKKKSTSDKINKVIIISLYWPTALLDKVDKGEEGCPLEKIVETCYVLFQLVWIGLFVFVLPLLLSLLWLSYYD